MKRSENSIELSYYQLTLLSYIKESHPNLSTDYKFIKLRADQASEAYSQAIKDGFDQTQAEELANFTLFQNLLFSKHDMIINVLWNEYPSLISQSEAKGYAVRILTQCEFLFLQYSLSDVFIYSSEYDKLYTELTGFIDLWIEENEL